MTTKEKILFEAVKLFASEGYEAVTVVMIAEAVGIRAPSLYKHYSSKRDIFDSVLREMERRDAEKAAEFSLPVEPPEQSSEAYRTSELTALAEFSKAMFRYWTEDSFASAFRRMLTVEQYRDAEMNALYHQYLGAGPLEYTAELLGSLENALALYAPMHLLYSVYDNSDDKAAVTARMEQHIDSLDFLKQQEVKK